MLVYLLYFCVSVYMYMFLCTRHHSLLIVSCVCILGRTPLITKSINQSINLMWMDFSKFRKLNKSSMYCNHCICIDTSLSSCNSRHIFPKCILESTSRRAPPSPLAIGQKTWTYLNALSYKYISCTHSRLYVFDN